ncbi:MAG: protein kinase [Gemmatimonadaceae bacterium]
MTQSDNALSPERWSVLEPLLDAVLELDDAQRSLYMMELQRRDPVAWAELTSLLHACELGDDLLSAPAAVTFAPLLAEMVPSVPMELGPYRLIREIGRGGMATVYLADDPKHGRQVAVKVLHAQVARRIGHERFLREIEIAAGLSHPHILPLHDSGEVVDENTDPGDDGRILFFVSPYVAGETLRDLLQRDGAMSGADVARIGGEIAMALEYAHRQGVVHLDIKPANILLQEGHAVITDFGIARAMSTASDQSATPLPRMGTPSYMSPEQASGVPDIDGRSDVFSLGCVLYELAMAERPLTLPARARGTSPFDVAALQARTSRELAAVIVRAAAPAREDRFASAGELAMALRDSMHVRRRPVLRGRRATYLAGVALVALGGALAAYRGRFRAGATAAAIPTEKSVAVLPFVNASGDAAQGYFADGLTEDVIKRLARSRDMRVSAPTSSFKFREGQDDAKDIGRQLHVAFLLRGSVQQSDSNIHVMAELIRAGDGSRVWSATFDRKLADVFAVQDEIAAKAVKALNTTLIANALTGSTKPRSAASYNLVLRARYLLTESTQENVALAISTFEQALHEEPRNALAYAGLARAYRQSAGQGWIPVAEGYAKSREAARRAIAVDPQLADGYEALAWVQSTYDWNWDAAQSSYARALELEPGNAESLRSAGLLMTRLGRYDEAISGLRKAIERDPLAGTYSNLGYALGAAGRWDEAEGAARTALVLGPNAILRHFNLARALLFQGRREEALREVQLEKKESWRLMGLAIVNHALGRDAESDSALAEYAEKYASHSAMQIAEVHAYRGNANAAFAWLDRAYAQHDPGISDLKDDPWLKGIRRDPRYTALLGRMNLR